MSPLIPYMLLSTTTPRPLHTGQIFSLSCKSFSNVSSKISSDTFIDICYNCLPHLHFLLNAIIKSFTNIIYSNFFTCWFFF